MPINGVEQYEAQDIVFDLFKRLDYQVLREVRVRGIQVDLLAEDKEHRKVAVEVNADAHPLSLPEIAKIQQRLEPSMLNDLVSQAIIVSFGGFSDKVRHLSTSHTFQYWSVSELRHRAAPFPDILARIDDLVSRNQDAKLKEPSRTAVSPSTINEGTYLIATLQQHIKQNTLSPTEYEELCMQVFAHVFDPDLYGFQKQVRTSDGANRYDFICRIKTGNHFWDTLRHDFRTRALLFECKNHEEKITADQVYSTERYLFHGALRTVCFLISRLGPNEGCIRAAQGAMREAGKLVLLLSNVDLIEIVKLKSEYGAAENYLDEKIWNFVVSLPR